MRAAHRRRASRTPHTATRLSFLRSPTAAELRSGDCPHDVERRFRARARFDRQPRASPFSYCAALDVASLRRRRLIVAVADIDRVRHHPGHGRIARARGSWISTRYTARVAGTTCRNRRSAIVVAVFSVLDQDDRGCRADRCARPAVRCRHRLGAMTSPAIHVAPPRLAVNDAAAGVAIASTVNTRVRSGWPRGAPRYPHPRSRVNVTPVAVIENARNIGS